MFKNKDVLRGYKYAEDVVAGEILTCKWTKLAAKKYLKELKEQKGKEYPFYFCEDSAGRVCRFVQNLTHTRGDLAGKPLKLEPWQIFFIINLYGWKNKDNHKRRFRTGFLFVSRKNGKSILCAALGLYHLLADGEKSPEVYAGATRQKQAFEVLEPAQIMSKDPETQEYFGIEVKAKSIYCIGNNGKFEPLIGDPPDGQSPSLAIVDEIHEHKDFRMIDTMTTGMLARSQPLCLQITTAGFNTDSPAYTILKQAKEYLLGNAKNDRQFSLIFGIDDEDDWKTEESLFKANPNINVSISLDDLKSDQQTAIQETSKQNGFKTKHLNVFTGARKSYLNYEKWMKNASTKSLEDFKHKDVYIGLDLGQKKDLCAVVLLFPLKNEEYHVFSKFYLAEERAEQKHLMWEKDGFLTLTEGNITDYNYIERDIEKFAKDFKVVEFCYDAWKATQTIPNLQNAGLTCVEIPQNIKHLSEPLKTIDALIEANKIKHDSNPILNWMISNVCAKEDWNGNVLPTKDKKDSKNKIDGASALCNSMNRALTYEHEDDNEPFEPFYIEW